MKKQLLWITCILALAACEKEIAPSNPCETHQATSAAFTIKEATYLDIIDPISPDFLMDTDSCYLSSIYFEAMQQDADSFIWQIGTEPEPRYGKQVNVVFPDVLRGTTFTIRLIVKRNKPNTLCFPDDNGIDTMIRTFYFLRHNEELSWEGTYYGSDTDKPDSMYTIVLGHSYDEAQDRNFIKVFGLPRGCKDTVNERFSLPEINYTNVAFERGGVDCDGKVVLGVFKNGEKFTIRQNYRTMNSGNFIKKNRTFTGIKIN
jgi:hypothetical protein